MNENLPIISIVMPVYNGASYIEDALCSILGQSFGDFELIIVDDGSTDDTLDIIQDYSDKRIILKHCQHDYIETLNYGISIAKGNYIVRMDADDKMYPDRLSEQYLFMEKHREIDVCGSWAKAFGLSDDLLVTPENNIDIQAELLLHNALIHPSVIIRREAMDEFLKRKNIHALYDKKYHYAEDYKLWIDFALSGFRLANIPKNLLLYRRSHLQVTSLFLDEVMEQTRDIQDYYMCAVLQKIYEGAPSLRKFVLNIKLLETNAQLCFEEKKSIVYSLYKLYFGMNNL